MIRDNLDDMLQEAEEKHRRGILYKDPRKDGNSFAPFTNSNESSLNLKNTFWTKSGTSAFLVLSGPSLNNLDMDAVADSGILTMGVNNSWSVFTPDLWTCVDPPSKFLYSGWMNPQIMKFVPRRLKQHRLKWKAGENDWVETGMLAGHAPNTYLFERNAQFSHHKYLTEQTVNWGQTAKKPCSVGIKSSRSVMFAAIKILYILGIRRIYLLGCDFSMDGSKGYAFDQHRGVGGIQGNNRSYNIMQQRFEALKPHFEECGLSVYNCNPESGLKVFPHRDLDEVIHIEMHSREQDYDTKGWYEPEPEIE